jgi:hypothetical protein
MTQLFELRRCEPVADPATPANRVALARKLLVGAIRGYGAASVEWAEVNESYPKLDEPAPPRSDEEAAERKRWRELLRQVDEDFDAAELRLGERILRLYDALAPADRRAEDDPDGYFVPRAVRFEGSTYVLAYHPNSFESHQNLIAVYRSELVIDLVEG